MVQRLINSFAVVLFFLTPAWASEPSLDLRGTTRSLRLGQEGELKVRLKVPRGYDLNREAPIAVDIIVNGNGLLFPRTRFSSKDLLQAKNPRLAAAFRAVEVGTSSASIRARFVICDDGKTHCRRISAPGSVDIQVMP